VARACAALDRGGLLIYPTDTLYALGARATDLAALLEIRDLKGRADDKPLPVIVADVDAVRRLAHASPMAERIARTLWPGPITLVLAARADLPGALTAGEATVAVRVPAARLARELARGGPLVATSANLAGEPAPTTCAAAVAAVGSGVALALDAGEGGAVASTIVDVTGEQPLLLRQGAVPWTAVLAACAGRDS
jgi:L-threonylcarbamoyladenylate synthase